jgi:hypothetical protein
LFKRLRMKLLLLCDIDGTQPFVQQIFSHLVELLPGTLLI